MTLGVGSCCFVYSITNSLEKSSTFKKISVILSRSIGFVFYLVCTKNLTLLDFKNYEQNKNLV
jgi:hypothetical protein